MILDEWKERDAPAQAVDQGRRLNGRNRVWWLTGIASTMLVIELGLSFAPETLEHWRYVLHRLYYLPIICAGLRFGWSGGVIAAILSGIGYLAHSQDSDSPDTKNALDRYLETMVFCLVGILAGVLSDRERSQRTKAEKAAVELRRVYQELQNNLEHVKRAARMSALGHLSAGLAHEIRNPLASIEGAAAIVQKEPDNISRRHEFLEIIQEESRRLNRLVTDFLDFARPRPPALIPTDIGPLIESVLALVSQTIPNSRIVFRRDIRPDLRQLRCDAEQLKQVLLNLLLNAVQAMPRGGEILVGAHDLKGILSITIKDQGPGIRPQDIDSIFDPFFTTKPTGTGLGLPVAYQIVQQHGGELSLRENGKAGASFEISFPHDGSLRT